MFILAHQFRGVSSENNRSDTYPADFAQASRVQSVKHLVSNATTPRRRLSYSWRHIGLEASALPRYRTRENEYRVRRQRIEGIAVLRTCRTCLPTLANTAHVQPPDIPGTPHSSHRALGFCSKFTAKRFASYL